MPAEQPAVQQLAEGTRNDCRLQSTKRLRIATRYETVEQFVSAFHRFCEDVAIFMPNLERSVGSVTVFSFELVGGRSVFAGVGAVVEEFTTTENRFGCVGIVIALETLSSDSAKIFERVLAAGVAARAAADEKRAVAPTVARAAASPIAVKTQSTVPEVSKVVIPSVVKPSNRAMTVIGIPTLSKLPAPSSFEVPVIIAPRARKPNAAPVKLAEPPPPALQKAMTPGKPSQPAAVPASKHAIPEPIVDAIPELIGGGDTIREVSPYALRALSLASSVALPVAPQPAIMVASADAPRLLAASPDAESVATVLARRNPANAVTLDAPPDEPSVVTVVPGSDGSSFVEGPDEPSVVTMVRGPDEPSVVTVVRDPDEPSVVTVVSVVATPAAPSTATPLGIPVTSSGLRLDPAISVAHSISRVAEIPADPSDVPSVQPVIRPRRWGAAAVLFVSGIAVTLFFGSASVSTSPPQDRAPVSPRPNVAIPTAPVVEGQPAREELAREEPAREELAREEPAREEPAREEPAREEATAAIAPPPKLVRSPGPVTKSPKAKSTRPVRRPARRVSTKPKKQPRCTSLACL